MEVPSDVEMVTITGTDDAPLLDAFWSGIYLDAFAAQREPIEAWRKALRGEAPYGLTLRLAGRGLRTPTPELLGGIAFEHYPQSRCALLTYMVVAPEARGAGLGRRLLDDAIDASIARGARYVLGEVDDPALHGEAAWARVLRFQRWGGRLIDAPYVQPALGEGLSRDRRLRLILFRHAVLADGDVIAAFVRELWGATEGDAALGDLELARITAAMRGTVRLVELARP